MNDDMRFRPRPLGTNILVKVVEPQKGSLSDTGAAGPFVVLVGGGMPRRDFTGVRPARGIVFSAGPGQRCEYADREGAMKRAYFPPDVKPGDSILFWAEGKPVVEIPSDDPDRVAEELVLMDSDQVLVVLDSIEGSPAEAPWIVQDPAEE